MSTASTGGGMLLKSSPWFSMGAIGFHDFYAIIKASDFAENV